MFEHLIDSIHHIKYDELIFGKWFKLGIYDFKNISKEVIIDKSKYYRFTAILSEDNPFRISTSLIINIDITKASFDKEIIKHINFKLLPNDKLDLIMEICRKDKYTLLMRNVSFIQHKNITDNILSYLK